MKKYWAIILVLSFASFGMGKAKGEKNYFDQGESFQGVEKDLFPEQKLEVQEGSRDEKMWKKSRQEKHVLESQKSYLKKTMHHKAFEVK